MKAFEIIRNKLVGNFYSRFSVGDTWDFNFGEFWLIAQNVISADENRLNDYLIKNYTPAQEAIDKEDIAKGIVVSSCLRKVILDVTLDSTSALTLDFGNKTQLTLPTNNDIVDWQWAINAKGGDPYVDCTVGCFNAGELQIGRC